MYRGQEWCTELPRDPALWDRDSPLPAPTWFPDAAYAFRDSLALAIAGDRDAAARRLLDTRGPELQTWFIEHAQNTHVFRVQRGQGLKEHTRATDGR